MPLEKMYFHHHTINLYDPISIEGINSNIISILVGKNSSGKSSVLSQILHISLNSYSHDKKTLKEALLTYENQIKESRVYLHEKWEIETSNMFLKTTRAKDIIKKAIENDDIDLNNQIQYIIHSENIYNSILLDHEMENSVPFHRPSRVVAISNTAYNRFPEYSKDLTGKKYIQVSPTPRKYHYEHRKHRAALSFTQRTIVSLLNLFNLNLKPSNPIYEDFNSIGCLFLLSLNKNHNIRFLFKNIMNFLGHKNHNITFFITPIQQLRNGNNKNYAVKIMEYLLSKINVDSNKELSTDILKLKELLLSTIDTSAFAITIDHLLENHDFFKSICFALEIGIFTIAEINFPMENRASKKTGICSIEDLSSGEISFLTLGLVLISAVEDNAIICIDEPEINLHPEWQQKIIRFFELLIQSYKNTHLILATHSPQVISNLPNENAFIVNLTKNTTIKSSEIIKKSADFQLTETFSAPGANNEYILRKLLIILEKINTIGISKLQKDDYSFIASISSFVDDNQFLEDDKALILFNIIKEILYKQN